ncbi:exo-alpha-sialidase [Saccharophagus sp. K07]|uniref:WD40/YVTN/BNR-like repeat-containing protein n=1 Tax=Saccharophagus sp. K07 TaxID=2283636 RepID=UPI00165243FC|nr:exo-alpha-sialidase [Saccharophagus sp. K07]MBC6904205.1 exo-alpha-sialidase [Saccharophagus sp. K07]
MRDRILLATRKGLLDFAKRGNTWVIAGQSFLGQPVSAVLRDPDNAFLYAALNLGHFGVKLHRSKDDGNSWEEIACPSYTGIATDSEEKANLQLIWILERDHQGHLWAGTIPGGLFKSTDNGDTWQLNEFLWHNPARKEWFGGGYDSPGIHSICIDPKRAGYMALAISCGGVWLSEDYGETWRPSTKGMVADYLPPEQADNPNQQDPHRLVQCPGEPDHFWVQHHNGIFYSKDRCATWTRVYAPPSSFGFAVVVHPKNPEQAWFVPGVKDEYRYPVDCRFCVTHTADGGRSFIAQTSGLPQQESFDLVYRHALDIDSSGDRLVMASTTGNMWLSENGGTDWSCVSNYLPPVYAVRFV